MSLWISHFCQKYIKGNVQHRPNIRMRKKIYVFLIDYNFLKEKNFFLRITISVSKFHFMHRCRKGKILECQESLIVERWNVEKMKKGKKKEKHERNGKCKGRTDGFDWRDFNVWYSRTNRLLINRKKNLLRFILFVRRSNVINSFPFWHGNSLFTH